MSIVSSLLWQTDSEPRKSLIRVTEGAKTAGVLVGECDAKDLRELAKAALEAAEQLEGFAADAAEVRGDSTNPTLDRLIGDARREAKTLVDNFNNVPRQF